MSWRGSAATLMLCWSCALWYTDQRCWNACLLWMAVGVCRLWWAPLSEVPGLLATAWQVHKCRGHTLMPFALGSNFFLAESNFSAVVMPILWFLSSLSHKRCKHHPAADAIGEGPIEIGPALSCLFKKTVHFCELSSDKASHDTSNNQDESFATSNCTQVLQLTVASSCMEWAVTAIWLFGSLFPQFWFCGFEAKIIFFFLVQLQLVYRGHCCHLSCAHRRLTAAATAWTLDGSWKSSFFRRHSLGTSFSLWASSSSRGQTQTSEASQHLSIIYNQDFYHFFHFSFHNMSSVLRT